ncbi:MAG: M56 family metallopeptidase [Gemmatimonadetes bacterium]|nr:M56 family metallopeptidase [Gemmatimonadota bacterium]
MPGSDSLLEIAARATVLLSVALVLAWLARRRPAGVRHLLWTTTFALLVALPALKLFSPAWEVSLLPAADRSLLVEPPAIVAPASGASTGSISLPAPNPPSLGARPATLPSEAPSSRQVIPFPLFLWGVGCAVSLVTLAVGRARFRRLVRLAHPVRDPVWLRQVDEVRERVGLRGEVRLYLTRRANTPMTGGLWRPAVLLPTSAVNWSLGRRRAVLMHEIIHVRRRDTLRQLLIRAALAVYWFHPLAWLASRLAASAREEACDEEVLACGARASEYAGHLLSVSTAMSPAPSVLSLPLVRHSRSQLERRIVSVLNPRRPRRSATATAVLLTAIGGVGVSAAVIRPVRNALQDNPIVGLAPAEQTLDGKKFGKIQSVRELSDGRVLLSDIGERERYLYVADLRTDEVRSLGRIGFGPGEFLYPGFLYPLGRDSTLFTDQNTHRAFLVVGDSHPETLGAATRLIARLSEPPWGADRFGRVLGVEGFSYPENRLVMSRVEADSSRILLTTGNVLDWEPGSEETIAEVGGQGRFGGSRPVQYGHRYYTSPLATEGQAWLFRDGWVAVAHPDPYRVDWRRPDGAWVRGVPLPFDRVPVTDWQKCVAATGDRNPDACDGPGLAKSVNLPSPDHIPPFVMQWHNRTTPGGIAVQPAPNGMLLIQRTLMADAPGRRYDVIDRTGSLRGTIRLPENQTIVGAGSSSLYVVTKDSADELTLSRHRWPDHYGARQ